MIGGSTEVLDLLNIKSADRTTVLPPIMISREASGGIWIWWGQCVWQCNLPCVLQVKVHFELCIAFCKSKRACGLSPLNDSCFDPGVLKNVQVFQGFGLRLDSYA